MMQATHDSAQNTDRMLAELASTEPHRFAATFFRQLCEKHSKEEAIQICVGLIARQQMPPAAQKWLIGWRMARDSSYIPVLFDPDFLTLQEAKRALAAFREHDALFHLKVQRFLCNRQVASRVVLRALTILADLDESTLVPLLRNLTHSEDEHIRSNASKMLCKLRPNRMLIERQLQSPDPRTRANAIEGLWRLHNMDAINMLRLASKDPHHRVAVNALVGLYYQKDRTAFDRLLEMARHESSLFRAAAIWAFGHLGDTRAIPTLEQMSQDPRPFIRRKAAEVLQRLRATVVSSPDSGPVQEASRQESCV
jgi:hypothetical protein